jgi:hypothetical protein
MPRLAFDDRRNHGHHSRGANTRFDSPLAGRLSLPLRANAIECNDRSWSVVDEFKHVNREPRTTIEVPT